MDTMTAPELLKQFQEAGEGIEAIHVDVSRMPMCPPQVCVFC